MVESLPKSYSSQCDNKTRHNNHSNDGYLFTINLVTLYIHTSTLYWTLLSASDEAAGEQS